ncbi:ATP-binding protein [Sphingomonas tabacisoli]|uniref:histidine kinase n=1 Tax=Sphingomonas tabacisoli TaxID=2249466 RepID=A0ABW4I2V5_9SPHN
MNAMGIAQGVRQRPVLAYSLGVLLALAGLALREALFPHVRGIPFITFFPAVALTAFLGGVGPALVCATIGGVLAQSLFVERDPLVSMILYGAVCVIVSTSISYAIRAYLRLEQIEAERRAELEEQVASRTSERDRLWSLSQDPLMIADRDGTWLTASPAWERILGWPLEELLGQSSTGIMHPDDIETTRREREFLFGGGTSVRFQNRYRTKDGQYRWFSWNAVAEGDRMYGIARDVTDVRETARQLEQTQEALIQSQKIEAMGKVTGGVAHDFNNLLTPILGGLDLLKRRGLPDPRMERLVDGALQAAERARTLVQRLLAFARRQPLQVMPVDLAELVNSLEELIESTIGPRITLRIDLPHSLPSVQADPAQLEMALLNLAVNAADAMPDGGTLSIAATSVRLTGEGDGLPAGQWVRLTVSDTGIGMSPQILERAVEPFYSTKGVGRGTGLGLSMVHGLMGQLGGALRVESAPGEGTRVHLWFPAAEASRPDPKLQPKPAESSRSAGTALLVDDEPLVRMSVAAMLDSLGYTVTEAESAPEALRLIESAKDFDVIVTDHLMPGMTGTELAAEVKRGRPDQRVVIISGYSDLDEIAPDFPRLAKPFKEDELAQLIAL